MIDKPRDLGRDPVTGEKRHDWEWIKRQVDKATARTNAKFAEHAAEVEARYANTPTISALAVLRKLLGG